MVVSLTIQLNVSYLFTHSKMIKTVPLQIILFTIINLFSQLNSSFLPISGASTRSQSGLVSDGDEGLL